MSGWVKLHRAIESWEWYKDANTFRVFLHLLINANYEPSRFMGVSIPVGSLPTGRKSLALALSLTEDKVRTSLMHLISTGEITQQNYPKFSVISITNWESYQEVPQQIPSKSPANPQQIPTLKEAKNKRSKEVIQKPDLVGSGVWNDFLVLRMAKEAPVTGTVVSMIEKEAMKAGITLEAALAECCARGWQSFKADWYKNQGQQSKHAKPTEKREGVIVC